MIKWSYFISIKDSSSLKPSVLGPGFTAPPGGEAYLNRLTGRTHHKHLLSIYFRTAMSWHYYCWALGYSHDQEFDPILRVVCDDVRIEEL